MMTLYLYIRNLLQREDGQDLAEYAILIGLIAIVVMAAVIILGTNLSTLFNSFGAEVGTWFGNTS
jgi:pilus assembly protein Flp/PilA